MVISMLAFAYYTSNTYLRWQKSPVILEFDQVPTDIFEIPFPAITMCPNFRFDKTKFDLHQHLKDYDDGKLNKSGLENLEIAAMLCDKWIYERLNHTPVLEDPKLLRRTTWFQHMVQNIWYKEPVLYFMKILTEEGYCHAFNTINADLIFRKEMVDPTFLKEYHGFYARKNPKFWSMEEGFTPDEMESYPVRSFDKGKFISFL
jgi:amiloride-sensitive sodium channel